MLTLIASGLLLSGVRKGRYRRRARTRGDKENPKAQPLVNKPFSGEKPDKSEQSEQRPTIAPTSPSNQQTSRTDQDRDNASYGMGPWNAAKSFAGFFDSHSGSFSALATLAIVVLTIFYVHYSKAQWQTMSRQQNDFEKTEGATLGTGKITIDFRDNTLQIPIENYGRIPCPRVKTVARVARIFADGHFLMTYYTTAGDLTQVPPGSNYFKASVPLEHLAIGDKEAIEDGAQILTLAGELHFDNGFGTEEIFGFCFKFVPKPEPRWDGCPVLPAEEKKK
jgi:hypothetical protein